MAFIIRKITTYTHCTRIEAGAPQKRRVEGFVYENGATASYESAHEANAAMLELPVFAPEDDAGYLKSYSYAVYDEFDVSRGNGIRRSQFFSEPVNVRNWE